MPSKVLGGDSRIDSKSSLQKETELECQTACQENVECFAYSFNIKTKSCVLKNKMCPAVVDSDTSSGFLFSRLGTSMKVLHFFVLLQHMLLQFTLF